MTPLVLVVHRSNNAAVLATALGDVVAAAPLPPLVPEIVVVQGRQVATWLSMRLAERFGVWSAGQFPFPRRFVSNVLLQLAQAGAPSCLDEPQRLQWAILGLLDRRLDEAPFAVLKRYCKDDATGQGRFGLAATVARMFDRYLIHRAELLASWEAGGEPDDWQAILWRDAVATHGKAHLGARIAAATEALRGGAPPGLPPRVGFFGISSLAPGYFRLVAALAESIDVHLFVPSPSPKWWADLGRRKAEPASPLASPDDGHPLLAAFGALGRDFARLLESQCTYLEPPGDLFRAPTGTSMLATLQADIAALRTRGAAAVEGHEPPPPALRIDPDDRSIVVFSCHSRLREVEVLHDRLLGMLADDPTLEPRDIVVHLADVDGYAPLVEAVFERDREDPTNLPFSIADRSPRAGNPTLDAWLRILALVGSRMNASDVLDLLGVEAVATRFGFTGDELDRVRNWVEHSGVHWGIDARHREAHGQPAYEEGTWRFGIRRLLLGVALPGGDRESFAGVLPFDEIEGQAAALLGRLVDACETLFGLAQRLAAPRSIDAWREAFDEAIGQTLGHRPGAQWELDDLRAAIVEVSRGAASAGFTGEVPLSVMRDAVVAAVDDAIGTRGSAQHGVMFGALGPMRATGARVVVMLGLDDGKFPRPDNRVDFDRMRQTPRLGDRSARDDDRYAFLEALGAASQHLLIGYVGQSSQDDRDLPPSVVLAELLDVLGSSFYVPGTEDATPIARAKAVRDRVVVRQPMQPFSPRNFTPGDPRLFSFSTAYRDGALAVSSGSRGDRAPLFTEPLPPLRPGVVVDLDDFIRFFRQPHAQLLRRRLDVSLKDWSTNHDDREPMALDGLESWALGKRLLELLQAGVPEDRCFELLRLSGALPLGALGEASFAALYASAAPLVEAVRSSAPGAPLPPLDVALSLGALELRGHLQHRYEGGLRMVDYARLTARQQVGAWIAHLVAAAAPGAPGAASKPTVVAGRAPGQGEILSVAFDPVAAPREILEALAAVYLVGMREPIPLFPRTAVAFLDAPDDPKRSPMSVARLEWANPGSEGSDEAVKRIYGDEDPLAPGFSLLGPPPELGDFATLSATVFGPMLAHRRER